MGIQKAKPNYDRDCFDCRIWIIASGQFSTALGHWAVVDLIGKGGNIRTVRIPEWLKEHLMNGRRRPE